MEPEGVLGIVPRVSKAGRAWCGPAEARGWAAERGEAGPVEDVREAGAVGSLLPRWPPPHLLKPGHRQPCRFELLRDLPRPTVGLPYGADEHGLKGDMTGKTADGV